MSCQLSVFSKNCDSTYHIGLQPDNTKLRSIIVVRVNEIATLREALRVRHLTAVDGS
ncbi:MAG: hypothetical protein QNJ63_22200 [Calothrix sp. MO_192.B10]|nr:hypothetical protein [Calothrix sp. MO_192.B10]